VRGGSRAEDGVDAHVGVVDDGEQDDALNGDGNAQSARKSIPMAVPLGSPRDDAANHIHLLSPLLPENRYSWRVVAIAPLLSGSTDLILALFWYVHSSEMLSMLTAKTLALRVAQEG